MTIKSDVRKFMKTNKEGMAESHLEGWKDRYFGYTLKDLRFDLDVNHDPSLELEYAEHKLGRELSMDEQDYVIDTFNKEVVKQYKNYRR